MIRRCEISKKKMCCQVSEIGVCKLASGREIAADQFMVVETGCLKTLFLLQKMLFVHLHYETAKFSSAHSVYNVVYISCESRDQSIFFPYGFPDHPIWHLDWLVYFSDAQPDSPSV